MSDIIVSKQDASQVLRLAFDDATQALRTTQSALAEQTVVQPDGSKLHVTVDASALPDGAATEAKQDDQVALLTTIDTYSALTATATNEIATDTGVIVSNTSSLDTKATAANASLASIDSKLTAPLAVEGPLTDAELRATPVPVSGTVTVSNPGLTDTELRATPVAVSTTSLPLPTGASTEATLLALSQKTAGALVPEKFDYQALTYVASGNGAGEVETITYKLGGSAGTLQATVTLAYDAQNRITSVTRT